MTNNTTWQRIIKKVNAIVSGNAVTGVGATLEEHFETGGTFTLNGATPVTVVEPTVGAISAIVITLKTVGGTVGAVPAIQTITAGTGFTVAGTAGDTSVYNYAVLGRN